MALKISEKTELKVSLKNVIGIIVTVVMASYAWFNVQERITSLEDTINKNGDIMRQNSSFRQSWKGPIEEKLALLEDKLNSLSQNYEMYQKQPSRSHTEVEVLKVEIAHIKEQIKELKIK